MNCYVYAYLDPRKKGRYIYEGLNISFLYEPFYIGKAKNRNRINDHLALARNTNINRYVLNKIRDIVKTGLEPFRIKVMQELAPQEASTFETKFITKIGRSNLGYGPLTNLTDGGEGTVGWKMPDTVKQKLSHIQQKLWTNERRRQQSIRGKNYATSNRFYNAMSHRKNPKGKKLQLNKSDRNFKLVNPNGIITICHGNLMQLLKTNGFSYTAFRNSLVTGKPILKGPAKGWQLLRNDT